MANCPNHLDLHFDSEDVLRSPNFHLGGLPSPRAGEVPPALSPLDAFALHSRALARKLETDNQNGKRLSRLPPLEIANELAKRPGFFRSMSGDSTHSAEEPSGVVDDAASGLTAKVAKQRFRPVSHYPCLSTASIRSRQSSAADGGEAERQREPSEPRDYFGMLRAFSPEPIDFNLENVECPTPTVASLTSSVESVRSSQLGQRRPTADSTASRGYGWSGRAPPRSPGRPRSPRGSNSVRSCRVDSDDADGSSASGSYDLVQPRKPSGSSGFSTARSPRSPFSPTLARSPSMSSEYSVDGSHFKRPSFNFSRPISRSSRPSFDTNPLFELPLRRGSAASDNLGSARDGPNPAALHAESTVTTPASLNTEEYFVTDPQTHPAPSYIYSKYSLPRGRIMQKGTIGPRESWAQHRFTWEESPEHTVATPVAPVDVATTTRRRSRSADHRDSLKQRSVREPHASSTSVTSDRTIKAGTGKTKTSSLHLSPEDHLEKGIESHNSGSLTKSTYHLRVAARAGLPTAMLLYALACRHGWGMRPNQAEGVQWLRKAVDCSGVEVADDEDLANRSPNPADTTDRKTRKAQFALAIYELGVSYMNGWGIEQDKALALRCFEIAGNWGDCDALAEAGFCYTQGVGCKKDLVKAAKFYRLAEAKGMSMAGNSWIYKDKYMEKDDSRSTRPAPDVIEKKPRDKTRTRTMFGRKK
ncbi:hypothetical protein BJ546DRAFT_1100008 [Cryomyces antarcticus]